MIVKFKPEFESELKRLKVKKLFVNNILKVGLDNVYTTIPMREVNILNSYSDFNSFIYSAFIFRNTPEGDAFWSTIADGRHVNKFK